MQVELSHFTPPAEASEALVDWVGQMARLLEPSTVQWCDGSRVELAQLKALMVEKGTAIQLDSFARPNSILCRTDPRDAQAATNQTFVCTLYEQDAGPNNHWMEPGRMKVHLHHLFQGAMAGRIMYVVPFCLGPYDSDLARFGVELTDSPYVVAHASLLTRMGSETLARIGKRDFVRCVHSVGAPLPERVSTAEGNGDASGNGDTVATEPVDVPWPCDPDNALIAHFPESGEIWSYGSANLENALLSREPMALRLGSAIGHEEGWIAAHMAVFGLKNPRGHKKYFGAVFPRQTGKTQLATTSSVLPGWQVQLVADDVAWLRPGPDGRVHATSLEIGMLGLVNGLSPQTNPNLNSCLQENVIFTNAALTPQGYVWWEGMTPEPPEGLVDWRGEPWTSECEQPAAHPAARFAVSLGQYASLDEHWEAPAGVPLDALLFGGRRANTIPLTARSFGWHHGIMLGTALGTENLPFEHDPGKVDRDPFAMRQYCGFHLGSYVEDFLNLERKVASPSHLPVVFAVNWFLLGSAFRRLWPGYSENVRVLKWIFENIDGADNAVDSPVGRVPRIGSLDLRGMDLTALSQHELLTTNQQDLRGEAWVINESLQILGERIPPELEAEVEAMGERLLTGFLESTANRPGRNIAAAEVLGTNPHQAVGIPSR